jgi:hypothetical protein
MEGRHFDYAGILDLTGTLELLSKLLVSSQPFVFIPVVFICGLTGCDFAYEAVVCNGFREPIQVVTKVDSLAKPSVLPINPGDCEKPSKAVALNEQSRLPVESLANGISIFDESDRKLSRIDPGAFNEGPSLHAPLQLMLTDDGVFLVSYEFSDVWFANTKKAQEAAWRSWPNLEKSIK